MAGEKTGSAVSKAISTILGWQDKIFLGNYRSYKGAKSFHIPEE